MTLSDLIQALNRVAPDAGALVVQFEDTSGTVTVPTSLEIDYDLTGAVSGGNLIVKHAPAPPPSPPATATTPADGTTPSAA